MSDELQGGSKYDQCRLTDYGVRNGRLEGLANLLVLDFVLLLVKVTRAEEIVDCLIVLEEAGETVQQMSAEKTEESPSPFTISRNWPSSS